MLVFDKTQTSYTIITTVSEKSITVGNELVLKLHSRFSNVSFSLILPASISAYPKRFDKFIITEFEDYPVGIYNYSIVERIPISLIEVQTLEIGLLKVIDTPVNVFVSIDKPETDDDFIVYSQ